MRIKRQLWIFVAAIFFSGQAMAQNTKSTASVVGSGSASDPWSFSITADGYVVPHSEFFVSPIFTGDRNRLHLEARYNYEDQQTGSLWIGYNLSLSRRLTLEVTPMIGGVFGNTTGIAPGYEVSLSYKKLSLSSSGEYVFAKKPSDSFFYSWPELTYSPADWFRLGLVAQRTKTYHTSLDTQRGFLVGFSRKKLHFTTYIFNAGWTEPTVVFEAGLDL
jgi:hypothetical protein